MPRNAAGGLDKEQKPELDDAPITNRQSFSVIDSIRHIWSTLGLPLGALKSLQLIDDDRHYASSFKIDDLAHTTIALSALAAALVWSTRTRSEMPTVSIAKEHACAEFVSERIYTVDGKHLPSTFNAIGGLHKTADGHVRMHDGFPHHRNNALKNLGLREDATRDAVAAQILKWKSIDLETAAFKNGAVIVALRSFDEWDALSQAKAVPDFPITVRRFDSANPPVPPPSRSRPRDACLRGMRIVELSRVIAAPVAGRTLAAHGADVIWVTSPTLPNQPELDIDTARGKRTVQLDIKKTDEKARLLELVRTADVFMSSYRPGSLAAQDFSPEDLAKINPNLVVATLNAWGDEGPWAKNRGFDSLVQTASGINVVEAEHHGQGEPSRVLPCQALDHGSGYLLATGIMAALYKRERHGGVYEVHVSLAGTMKYLRSLGQAPENILGRSDFPKTEALEEFMESRNSAFGNLKAITHSARIDGVSVGYTTMPKPLGSDDPVWL
ncbi:CoA-transferase family III [Bimuria novae-zelandiae CBS 107.79]|uniref:CoA-transferase family III n=1 Tax=Bimuria novae-zelandiae CBS 107.79 TaxID=1447943 RepID=A0A6A5V666_9PLEO|nr:CoA-transferase family III [Bimuria novae-zelandiae CBS 107.79]